ncbi:hypothetical protein M758_4G111600 [Ceratodon purpureus]|nr:hypothetical protein M758_4G111600 [Ceratodon purpureus]
MLLGSDFFHLLLVISNACQPEIQYVYEYVGFFLRNTVVAKIGLSMLQNGRQI